MCFKVLKTLLSDCLDELLRLLRVEFKEVNTVVMPDFFVDRLISLDCDAKDFSKTLENIIKRKGGSIDGIDQTELRGGNAVNTASALAALGMKVTPIVCTSKLGQQLIQFYLKPCMVDLSHVKIFEKLSVTTAIELKAKNGKANVMFRSVGSLVNFGPHDLDSEDFEAIKNADYVCVFNWAGTRRFGTELARTAFRYAKTHGKGKTYYDTADPTPNKKKIPELLSDILQSRHVDILSVNENEAICYASRVSDEVEELGKRLKFEELAKEAAKILASQLSARVDLHTTSFAATFTKKSATIVPGFQVRVLRTTGAGDAWNAGNIVGDAQRLSDDCRLTLANAVAACYICSPNGMHPSRKQLTNFLERAKQKTNL
jgi:sugar/nucleoside kinase (ribokinase family)